MSGIAARKGWGTSGKHARKPHPALASPAGGPGHWKRPRARMLAKESSQVLDARGRDVKMGTTVNRDCLQLHRKWDRTMSPLHTMSAACLVGLVTGSRVEQRVAHDPLIAPGESRERYHDK